MRKKLQVTLTFGNSDEGGDKYKKLNMEKRITSFNKTKKSQEKEINTLPALFNIVKI